MADAQVTSNDYNSLSAIQSGTIDNARFMGATVHVISDASPDENAVLTGGSPNPQILPKTGNIRTTYLYHRDAVGLSFAKEVSTYVAELPEHLHSWQVLVMTSFGAVRILDAGVVTIDIDESV